MPKEPERTAPTYQYALWPGVLEVESCEYVCSHGITPGRAVLVTYPQSALELVESGELEIGDGKNKIVLRDCRVERVSGTMDGRGTTYTLEIVDRRWRWRTGGISGVYNLKDDRAKLVPDTIRSPYELARLCLMQMGELNPDADAKAIARILQNIFENVEPDTPRGDDFETTPAPPVVNLPPGLKREFGKNLDRYFRLGENAPQTLTNPEVVWDHTPPAQALARLAELYGCRVIFQPFADRVLVGPLGKGKTIPDLPAEMKVSNLEAQPAPQTIGAYSTEPVKIQARFLLEAVGKDWDGKYVPINELSYAPSAITQPQTVEVDNIKDNNHEPLSIVINWKDADGRFHTVSASASGATPLEIFNKLAAAFSADAAASKRFTFSSGILGMTIQGKVGGKFDVILQNPNTALASTWARATVTVPGGEVGKSWEQCPPPSFYTVQSTDRLSRLEAISLAQETVFKCYRIIMRDPHQLFLTEKQEVRPYELPWYGKLTTRRHQVVLQATKVEQVVPSPRIPGAVNRGNVFGAPPVPAGGFLGRAADAFAGNNVPPGGVLPEFYNGYSRARAATVSGSVWKRLGGSGVWYFPDPDQPIGDNENTGPEDRVFVPFEVDSLEGLIKFSEPVYRYRGGAGAMAYLEIPLLTLETGVFVRDAENGQFQKWEVQIAIPGGTGPTEWFAREDMKVGVIGEYVSNNAPDKIDLNKLVNFTFDGKEDAQQRAEYYLNGLAAAYQIKGGDIRQLIGLIPFDPDGYCQQVSYKIGPGGATTILSGNTEFHPAIVPYPARRRAENLAPDVSSAAANLLERPAWDLHKPEGGK